MKRLLFLVALMTWTGSAAVADETPGPQHADIGLGFHAFNESVFTRNSAGGGLLAPFGVRWWFGDQKYAADLGFGFRIHKEEVLKENLLDYDIDAGVPIRIKSWDKVHVIIRPGFNFSSSDEVVFDDFGNPIEKVADKLIMGTVEMEAEVFLAQNFTVSASNGLAVVYSKPGLAGSTSTTDVGTFGSNFVNLGFHVYLFGGK